MKKLLIVALVLICLAGVGTGYAHWTGELVVDGTVATGEVDVCFTSAQSDDPDSYADPGRALHVGRTEVEGVGSDTLTVTVTNAYPCYQSQIDFVVTNVGSVPVDGYVVVLNPNPEVDVTVSYGDLLIGPGQSVPGTCGVHVEDWSEQEGIYTFSVRLNFSLYTIFEGKPRELVIINQYWRWEPVNASIKGSGEALKDKLEKDGYEVTVVTVGKEGDVSNFRELRDHMKGKGKFCTIHTLGHGFQGGFHTPNESEEGERQVGPGPQGAPGIMGAGDYANITKGLLASEEDCPQRKLTIHHCNSAERSGEEDNDIAQQLADQLGIEVAGYTGAVLFEQKGDGSYDPPKPKTEAGSQLVTRKREE